MQQYMLPWCFMYFLIQIRIIITYELCRGPWYLYLILLNTYIMYYYMNSVQTHVTITSADVALHFVFPFVTVEISFLPF